MQKYSTIGIQTCLRRNALQIKLDKTLKKYIYQNTCIKMSL